MVRRLFIALTPPPAVVDHLDVAVAPLREQESGLRWTKPPMWHLTLAFLGDVDEDVQARLEKRLANVSSRYEWVGLRFKGAGAFSRPASARVLWIGVETDLLPLRKLADSCAAAGRKVGLEVDDRTYRPHLTLARAKAREGLDVRPLVEQLSTYEGPSWTASEIHLVRSHLGPSPWYETLVSWPLQPPNQQ